MDWQGLLNWSLKYQDGTVNKDLQPMSEEDKKFLEDAFESTCVNEMKEIWKILDKLKQPETKEDKEERTKLIEDLIILIDGSENARNVVRGKRFGEIIEYFFSTSFKEIRMELANLLTTMMQNDGFVQKEASRLGIFKSLQLLHDSEDKEMHGKYIYLMTGLLFGDEIEPKEIFVHELDGIKLINNLIIKNKDNAKSFKRLLNILIELTKTDLSESIRQKVMDNMKEYGLHKRLFEYASITFIENKDHIDELKLILKLLINIVRLWDNLEQIFSLIKNLNSIKIEDEEDRMEFKKYLMEIIKDAKEAFKTKVEPNTNDNEKEFNVVGNKESMHIQLKK